MLHLLYTLFFAWSKGDLWNAHRNASVGLFVYIYLSFEFISLLISSCFLFFFFEIFPPRVTVDWCPKFSSPGHVYKTTASLTTIKCSFPTFVMKMWFSHINLKLCRFLFVVSSILERMCVELLILIWNIYCLFLYERCTKIYQLPSTEEIPRAGRTTKKCLNF